ncbi:MAG: hypothetical protein ACI9VR_000912 [Cognaticolwellia sp.]
MIRRLSGPERIWLNADSEGAPFALSIVVPGDGNTVGLQDALTHAARANPAPSARLSKGLWSPKWTAGEFPLVKPLAQAPRPGPLDWLPRVPFQLSVAPGPTLIFTSHHALMDGRGLWHLVQEVFRAWRGEPLLGGRDDIDDRSLLQPGLALPAEERFPAPTGQHRGASQPIWAHTFVPGPQRRLLPRLALAISRHARTHHGPVPLRFDVPVDLRDGVHSTANLTGIASLNVPAGASLDQIQDELKRVLDGRQAQAWLKKAQELRWVPHWAIPALVRKRTQADVAQSLFPNAGVLSNMGRVDLSTLNAPGFSPKTCFWIPPCGPNTTAFVGLMGDGQGLHLSIVMPQGLSDKGRLDALLSDIQAALQSSSS